MALIREVVLDENSRLWGYIEWSDLNPDHVVLLGDKGFYTRAEAEEFAKGFQTGGYKYFSPPALILKRFSDMLKPKI